MIGTTAPPTATSPAPGELVCFEYPYGARGLEIYNGSELPHAVEFWRVQ
jgi:hypothetical protein